ncbi:MAG: hypothetical protein A2Y14_05010 [Verrucomicrobia bacterium GWF2_51_19]|nr:MAG: hypothetical protein A2Y14_05010 [Verrucomicrobia bacterium GWF2_51_19]HCJ11633.1 hypothetical protein [Opitutae bacterium]
MFILVIAQFLISQVETSYTLMANFKLIADMRGLSASLEKDMRQKDTFEVKYENGSWATAPVNEPGNRLIVTLIDGDTIQYDVTPVTLNGLTYNRVTRKRFYSSASKYLTEELSHDVTGQMTGTLENQLFMLGSNSELYISGVLNRSGKHGVTRQSTFQMVLY